MVEDAIQQGLMFNVSEKYWESLEECDGILAIYEEKIYNLINDLIEGQKEILIISPEIRRVLNKYSEVISKGD